MAFVTGGASGIGKAVVQRLAGQGAYVCIADINEQGRDIARDLGDNVKFIHTDVS